MRYVIDAFIVISIFFAFAGVMGVIRMPDTFCRMQSSTNIATLGVLGVIIAGALYAFIYLHDVSMGVKLIAMGIFYIVTNPISGHALAKGAYKHGVRPEKEMEVDQYKEDME